MANDKRFVVKNGLTAQNVQFVDDTGSTNNVIVVSMLNSDTLSFSGNSGQLFSITDDMSGTIFAVNDISGVPSIEVDADGSIRLAEFFGNVAIGKASANSALDVQGTITANNFAGDGSALTGVDADTLDGQDGSYYLDWTNTTNKPDPTVTVSLSGDVSGSGNATLTDLANGTISITTTVADDSHNHVIGNIDGLQTELDGKLSTTGKAADSELLDGLDSSKFLRSDVADIASANITFTNSRARFYDTTSAINAWELYQNSNGKLSFTVAGTLGAEMELTTDGVDYTNATLSVGGNRVLTVADEGAGNGLDADTVDGQQGSYYLDWTNTTNKPDPNIVVTLSGDVSGSGNATLTDLANGSISITTTVADDSHNHIIGNIDGLQTALDGKLSTSGKAADSDLLDGLNSTQFLRSDANDTATGDVTFSGNVAINTLVANSSPGAAGQMLTSNGTTTYWSTPASADDALALAIALG